MAQTTHVCRPVCAPVSEWHKHLCVQAYVCTIKLWLLQRLLLLLIWGIVTQAGRLKTTQQATHRWVSKVAAVHEWEGGRGNAWTGKGENN
eukprot:1143133-Pelagomonas_calceolata.AAC.2